MPPMNEEEFVIPVALPPKGAPVPPSKAQRGTAYICVECRERVLFRKGEIRQPHFAHQGGFSCSRESILHRAGKLCIAHAIEGWKTGTFPKPLVVLKHPVCGQETFYDLPDGVLHTKIEHRIESGRVIDVALMNSEGAVLGVEIYVTHRVDGAKRLSIPFPWVELDAEELLEAPSRWVCRQEGGCFPECGTCKAMVQTQKEVLDGIVAREKLRLASLETERTYQRLHQNPFSFPNRKLMAPPISFSRFHPTTFMSPESVEVTLKKVSEILDLLEDVEGPVPLPGGGEIEDAAEFVRTIRGRLEATSGMEEYSKKAILWQVSEFLVPMLAYVKGPTPEEKEKNVARVKEALSVLGSFKDPQMASTPVRMLENPQK